VICSVNDAWNRLVSVTVVTVGTDTITYGYDALGRRITETDSAAGTRTDLYYSDRGQVVEQDTTTSDLASTASYHR